VRKTRDRLESIISGIYLLQSEDIIDMLTSFKAALDKAATAPAGVSFTKQELIDMYGESFSDIVSHAYDCGRDSAEDAGHLAKDKIKAMLLKRELNRVLILHGIKQQDFAENYARRHIEEDKSKWDVVLISAMISRQTSGRAKIETWLIDAIQEASDELSEETSEECEHRVIYNIINK
jgi:hypothetical protein